MTIPFLRLREKLNHPLISVFTTQALPTTKGGSGVARNFKRGRGHNFHIFCQAYFFGRTNLKLIKKQEKL